MRTLKYAHKQTHKSIILQEYKNTIQHYKNTQTTRIQCTNTIIQEYNHTRMQEYNNTHIQHVYTYRHTQNRHTIIQTYNHATNTNITTD